MRTLPEKIFARVFNNVIRFSDIALLYRTDSFSREFYEYNLDLPFKSRLAAIWHYVFHGAVEGYEPSPFFSRLWLQQQGINVRNLADYLRSGKRLNGPSPHPLFEDPTVNQIDQWNFSKWGKLEDFSSNLDRIKIRSCKGSLGQVNWSYFGHFLDHSMSRGNVHNLPTQDIAVSVIVDDVSSILRANQVIESISTAATGLTFEIILIPSSNRPDLYSLLRYLEFTHPEVQICYRSKISTRGELLNLAIAISKADRVLFMHSGHRFQVDSFTRLLRVLDGNSGKIIQPLILDSNGLIWSAGIVFPYGTPFPVPWLRGISPETADMPPSFSAAAAQFPIFFKKPINKVTSYFHDEIADNWIDVDLSLRLADRYDMHVEVLTDIHVIKVMKSPYEPSSLEPVLAEEIRLSWNLLGLKPGIPIGSTTLSPSENNECGRSDGVDIFQMRKPDGHDLTTGAVPRLRWSIKTSAPSNLVAKASYNWGDWYFAQSLSDALRRLGQIVTVDSVENRGKVSGSLDDVVLNLRGLEPIIPVRGAVNLTWVISHPELVTREEVQASQITYAASDYWAESKSREWSVNIRTLLQCTDSSLFYPQGQAVSDYDKPLFVGNAVNRDRSMVEAALRMGVDLDIYGRGWEGKARPDQIRAQHVDNAELRRLYAAARVTVNDHWPNMRDWGFMSNRAFDVVASGGRLLSDKLHGLPAEISQLMDIQYDIRLLLDNSTFPILRDSYGEEANNQAADYVLTHHTFDVRARRILEDVLAYYQL